MPHRTLRRRAPGTSGRRSKPPHHHHHPSPSPRRRSPPRSSNKSKPIKILKRCSSAPSILSDSSCADEDQDLDCDFGHEGSLFQPQTFSAAFASSPSLLASSPQNHETQRQGSRKEAKVVVSVTVEGSPGPIRTMVKLGSSVDDTIKLVVNKYGQEGRTPKIDPDASASFQLYDSHFSLQGLEKSVRIGDVGSRSFYMRKSNKESPFSSFRSERPTDLEGCVPPNPPHPLSLPCFKINKFVRMICRIWKMVLCSK